MFEGSVKLLHLGEERESLFEQVTLSKELKHEKEPAMERVRGNAF